MKRQINFTSEEMLNQIALYDIGVPTYTIAALYKTCGVTMWKRFKEYEKFGLMRNKTRSETVSKTLSRKRKIPIGNKKHIIENWKNKFGREGLIDILAITLLTDGEGNYKYKTIGLANTDIDLLEIFVNLLEELNLNPRIKVDKRTNVKTVFSRQNKAREILKEVYKRTPTTKHQPQRGKQSWQQYSKETQPTLSPFYGKPTELIKLLFRIGISFEGCVVMSKTKKRYGRPLLQFTCFHPILIKEWQNLAEIIGIKMIKNGNVLHTNNFKSVTNFLKIGGFIEGSKAGGNSRYFKGIEKNKIFLAMLEYSHRKGNDPYTEKSLPTINKEVRKIIDNKEFNTPNFYIKYFSNLLKKYSGNLSKAKILKLLENKPARVKEIIKKVNMSESGVHSILKELCNNEKITKVSYGVYTKND
ncbi:MAG: hypothetical protein ABIJ20_02920 [Nanoarchaeota archaeon]|nr:hypothetical protein [Nanoarchaeota archaeon]MBU1445488.1 hypothetical protein [Nanoarchaeota archaeon]MBU2420700.1 hypothetical protein [Nanoarchaeota archaeon]MBU2475659.1 hypothetical protein [Nanoarchaeota archaeon]